MDVWGAVAGLHYSCPHLSLDSPMPLQFTLAIQAKYSFMLVLKYTVGFMFILSFFMIFMPEKIVWIFTDDIQTIKEASLYLQIVGVSQIPLAFNFVLSGALRGAGDTKRTLKINLTSLWLVRIIPAFLLSWYFELPRRDIKLPRQFLPGSI
ncbi:MAG: Multidrug resistance protein MdtK [Candidatus Methanocomedens sp.]|nr:MAG: Multidrug resistance protein MdtK [ANME-2 cluster archaeon]